MAKDEKEVLIYHTGDAHGPLDTAAGRLAPGQSLSVPKALAERLIAAYPHVKLASSLIPGSDKADAEKAKLQAKVKELEAANEAGAKENEELKAKLAEASKGSKKDKKDAASADAAKDADKKDEPAA